MLGMIPYAPFYAPKAIYISDSLQVILLRGGKTKEQCHSFSLLLILKLRYFFWVVE